MLNFSSLYSGSTGNSLFLQSDNSKVLIDSGVSAKKIIEALASFNVNVEDLDAIVVTHEHSDHIQSLGTLSKKYNIPVYATKETFDAMPKQTEKIMCNNINCINTNEKFEINDLTFKPFSIPHDAANPCGFNIYKDAKKISIATDIGHMTNSILKNLEESLFVLLEANYDPEVLRCSPYPFSLKSRIAGPTGHLPNEMAGKTISYLLQSGLKSAMLGHLSKQSNFPELAYQTVLDELISNNYDENSLNLAVAKRDSNSKLIEL